MKCNKCGNEMHEWFNQQTNQNMATCDTCKYDMPIFNQQYSQMNQMPRKNSGMSVVALILSISGCFCFIGLILGIIDLVKKDKAHKHTLSIAAIVVAAVWIVLGMAFGGSDSSSSSNDSAPTVIEQTSDSDTTADTSTSSETNTNSSEESSEITTDDTTAEVSSETEAVPEISEEDFKASCQPFDYKTIARNPDDYIGQNFVVDVKIFQTTNGAWYSDYDVYYKAYTNDEYDLWMGDFLYIIDCQDENSESYLKVLDDDIIRVYGTFNGMTESQNALTGTTNDEISLDMYYCELISE